MRKLYLFLPTLFWTFAGNTQNKKQTADSKIEKVTVFLQGAQVNRSEKANIAAGKTDLAFINISPLIDKQSIQVTADGKITVLSVIHQLNFLKEQEVREELQAIEKQKSSILEKISAEKNIFTVMKQEENMLVKNQEIKGYYSSLKTSELKEAVDFQRQRLTDVYNKQTESERTIKKLETEIEKLNKQLHALNEKKDLSTSEVIVTVLAKESAISNFTLSYLVKKAGWYPTYDIRVKDISSPIDLQYKANVSQSSGEDWKDIKLFLSTGNPNEDGTRPMVSPWYLRYTAALPTNMIRNMSTIQSSNNANTVYGKVLDSKGDPLPFASVVVKGTTTGVTTNAEGFFSLALPSGASTLVFSSVGLASTEAKVSRGFMSIVLNDTEKQLSEVVVTAYGTRRSSDDNDYATDDRSNKKKKAEPAITTSTFYQPTTVVYEIDEAYTVLNDGKVYTADINTYELKALYEYYAAPRIDPDAYLTARITDWQELNLLSGEANLFFEGTFLGKSLLDVINAGDTLNLSLGKDKGVIVKRTLMKEFSQKKFFGNNRVDTRHYEILVRNNKQQSISIIIEDQFPISTAKEIEVENKQARDGKIDEETQKVTWQYTVEAKKEIKVALKY